MISGSTVTSFQRQVQVTADRGGAGSTFLGKQVAEAVEAVGEVVPRGEALAGQLLLAPDANEALLMPGLVPVVHSSGGDGLKGITCCVYCQKSARSKLYLFVILYQNPISTTQYEVFLYQLEPTNFNH